MPPGSCRRRRPLLIPALLCALIAGTLSPRAARAVPINVVYGDDPGEGFNDPSLGAARRAAMEFAAAQWADTLAGNVPIVINAFMDPLGGSGSGALLASTRATTLHRDFGGGLPGIWYGAALANEISGTDLNGPDTAEIEIHFNSDVDGPDVLGSISWYYGTDGQPGADVDMVSVTLHELGHGLNFFDTIDETSGDFSFSAPSIFDLQLMRPGVGSVESMLSRERLAAITSGALFWDGPAVLAAFGGPAPLYAPYPFVPGSSISHWDTSLTPDELMEPSTPAPTTTRVSSCRRSRTWGGR